MPQQHCDPDTLAVAAVDGTGLSESDQQHLAECRQCADELAGFRAAVDVGRDSGDIALVTPPDSVWHAVETEISAASAEPVPPSGAATVTSLDTRRERGRASGWARWLPVGVAAAAGAVFGGLLVTAAGGGESGPTSPGAPQIVAQAQLAALPDGVDTIGSGQALFEKDADGKDILVLDTENLEQASGYYQVWLINPDTSGLISLGTVGSGAQEVTFPVPAGVDPKDFSVVDISDEPLDGDPNHSKVSVLRGELEV